MHAGCEYISAKSSCATSGCCMRVVCKTGRVQGATTLLEVPWVSHQPRVDVRIMVTNKGALPPNPRRSPRGRPADSSPAVAGVFRLAPGVMDGKYVRVVEHVGKMGRCPKPRRSPRGRPADSSPAIAGAFRLAPGVRRVVPLHSNPTHCV